jgi:hypothetical protein
MTTTKSQTIPATANRLRYCSQVFGVLLIAFIASAAYTVYTTVAGLPVDGFSATEPLAWAYYAVGIGAAVAVRTDRRSSWWALAVLLPSLLTVSVLVYPASFVPELQTPLGWTENDGYVALLAIALYLTIQRLRRAVVEP